MQLFDKQYSDLSKLEKFTNFSNFIMGKLDRQMSTKRCQLVNCYTVNSSVDKINKEKLCFRY